MTSRNAPGLGNPNARDTGFEAQYTPSQQISVEQIEALAWLVSQGDYIDAPDVLDALEQDIASGVPLNDPDAHDFVGFRADQYQEVNDSDMSDAEVTGHVEYSE